MQKNNYNIQIDFTRGVSCKINSDENRLFLVEIYEKLANDSIPRILESSLVFSNQEAFQVYRNWHGNYHVKVYDWNNGIRLVHTEDFNYFNKKVLFVAHTLNDDEFNLWLKMALDFSNKQGFSFNFARKSDNPSEENYNRVYHIGRFISTQPMTLHEWPLFNRQIWRRYFNEFNPRDWSTQTSEEIFNDIVGISENKNGETFTIKSMYLEHA